MAAQAKIRNANVLLITVSILLCGLIIFWMAIVVYWCLGAFALSGLPFFLFSLFLVVGCLALDAALRRNTSYALTDKRVLILRTGVFSSFTAIPLKVFLKQRSAKGRMAGGY